MRKANGGASVGRGVWVAQWLGERGGIVLVAVKRNGRRCAELEVMSGEDHVGAGDRLWDILDREDPEPMLRVI